MESIVKMLTVLAGMLISVLELCFFLHAILSWFVDESNTVYRFTALVVEPVVRPVRMLLVKLNWFQGMPIDMSYLLAFLLVSFAGLFFA